MLKALLFRYLIRRLALRAVSRSLMRRGASSRMRMRLSAPRATDIFGSVYRPKSWGRGGYTPSTSIIADVASGEALTSAEYGMAARGLQQVEAVLPRLHKKMTGGIKSGVDLSIEDTILSIFETFETIDNTIDLMSESKKEAQAAMKELWEELLI